MIEFLSRTRSIHKLPNQASLLIRPNHRRKVDEICLVIEIFHGSKHESDSSHGPGRAHLCGESLHVIKTGEEKRWKWAMAAHIMFACLVCEWFASSADWLNWWQHKWGCFVLRHHWAIPTHIWNNKWHCVPTNRIEIEIFINYHHMLVNTCIIESMILMLLHPRSWSIH